MNQAEMELLKGQNLLKYEKEIFSRPARTWFQSEKEKKLSKNLSANNPDVKKRMRDENDTEEEEVKKKKIKRDKYAGMSRKKKRRMKLREDISNNPQIKVENLKAVRLAKKSQRPIKINKISENNKTKEKAKNGGEKKKKNDGIGFGMDLADVTKKKAFAVVPKSTNKKGKGVGKGKNNGGDVIKKKVKSSNGVKKKGKNVKGKRRK
jgi:ATP-dependent RNA helicase DDX27